MISRSIKNRLAAILCRSAACALTLIVTVVISTAVSVRAEDVFSDVPEAAGDRVVYSLNIDNADNYNSSVPYSVNNAASIGYGSFSRVGYYMLLQPTGGGPSQYAYASFDASGISFNASKLGIPNVSSGEVYNQPVSHMNVVSNVPGVVTGTGISTGTIQFWPGNYGGDPAAGGAFDYADTSPGSGPGYGHLEIGNTAAQQTILTTSNWGGNGGNNNVGIGNSPSGNPDYTFANNAGNFIVKSLEVVVNNTPANIPPAPLAPAAVTTLDSTLAGYHLVYQESVPANPNFASGLTYTQDFSHAGNVQQFDRVAYVMELHNSNTGADQWVSTSFSSHAFATSPGSIGIPTLSSGELYNQAISDLHVASNVAGVTTGDHISTGSVQFWPSNYNPDSSTGLFDYNDTGFNSSNGYGHLEIGNTAAHATIFGFNNWNGGGPFDIGIGNNPNGSMTGSGGPQLDWTFSGSAGNWTTENIFVLVQTVPEPSSVMLMGSAGVAGILLLLRRRNRSN